MFFDDDGYEASEFLIVPHKFSNKVSFRWRRSSGSIVYYPDKHAKVEFQHIFGNSIKRQQTTRRRCREKRGKRVMHQSMASSIISQQTIHIYTYICIVYIHSYINVRYSYCGKSFIEFLEFKAN